MADTRTTNTTTTIKKPKIHWRRVFAPFVIVSVVVVVLHAVYGWRAERALRQRVEQLAAAGEPMTPGDFDRLPADYDRREDGAPDLLAAAAIVDDDGPERRALDFLPTTRPIDPRAWPHLSRAKAWYEPALRRIERAQTKKFFRFEHHVISPVTEEVRLPELNGLRDLANLVLLAAVVEHHDGRDDLVVGRIEQLMFLAERADSAPADVGHYVALGIQDAAACRIEQFAPELNIGSGSQGGAGGAGGAGQVSPDELKKLIARLLDESAIAAGQRNAMQAQRMTMLDLLQAMGNTDVESRNFRMNSAARYVGRPFFQANALRGVEYLTEVATIAREQRDWPTAKGRIAAMKPIEDRFMFARVFASDPKRGMEAHFRRLTDRRMAATALAIRLYQLDHGGARPQRLDDLVPAYLAVVPLDAMAAGNRRISYLPRAEHPVLYSVGENGDDDAGSEAAMSKRYGELEEWDRLDRAFYLSGRTREVIYVERPGSKDEMALVGAAMPAVVDGLWEPGTFNGPPWEEPPKAAGATTQPTLR